MRLFLYALALTLAVVLGACEESVNPILESDRQFTLFGTLDMNRDTQYVRVIPIRPTLESDAQAPLDVSFTSTDLVTGETVAWRDSTVRFSNGAVGHVFYAPIRVRPGHTYRVDVASPGAALVTSAETTVPAEPRPVVMPEEVMSFTTPAGTSVRATQQVFWQGVATAPFEIQQWYRFFVIDDFSFRDVRLPYVSRNGPAEGQAGDWEISLNLVQDRAAMDSLIELGEGTALAGLGMTLTLLDDAFVPPGGAFDPDVLSQPGTLSNVDNGFGFVGSVGRFSVEWLLADTTARALRYRPVGRPFARPGVENPERARRAVTAGSTERADA